MKNKKTIALAMAAVSTMGAVAPVFACTQNEINSGSHTVDLHVANNRDFEAWYLTVYESQSEEFKTKNPVVALTKIENEYVCIIEKSRNNPDKAKDELKKLKNIQTEIKSDLEKTYIAEGKERPVYEMEEEEVPRNTTVGTTPVTVIDYKVTLTSNLPEGTLIDGTEIKTKTFTFEGLRFDNPGLGFDEELPDQNHVFNFAGSDSDRNDNIYFHEYRRLNQVIFELNEAKANNKVIIVRNDIHDRNGVLTTVELNVSLMDGTRVANITINNIPNIAKDGIKVIPGTNDFNNHWAKDTIVDSMLDGVVDIAEEFRPEDSITRAEFAKIMVKRFNIQYENHMIENFTDVKANDWHYKYVTALANHKVNGKPVLEGNGDGTFRPDAPITRQEAAKMIATLLNKGETYIEDKDGNRVHTKVDTTHIFADGKEIAEWADESVKNLNGLKVGDTSIITGYEENGKTYFKPANNINRSEALVMMDRAYQTR